MTNDTELSALLKQYLETAVKSEGIPTFPTEGAALAYVALEVVRLAMTQPNSEDLFVESAVLGFLYELHKETAYWTTIT